MTDNIAYTMTMRVELANKPGVLGMLTTIIGASGSNIGAIDIVRANRETMVRDITVQVKGEAHGKQLVDTLNSLDNFQVLEVSDRVFLAHIGGKLSISSKVRLKTREDLSTVYTPGVARVCTAIAEEPEKAYALTIKRNSVAVVTDGSAVLGLGNIGPEAAMPVMEGKAILFKEFANIDAYPIVLKSQDPEVIIQTIEQISPGFGGINLEDIASPMCFEIERELSKRLSIPVFHDDQHGTAVVVLSAVLNTMRLTGKQIEEVRIIVNGIGAAGTAIIELLQLAGVGEITAVDAHGILNQNDTTLSAEHLAVAQRTNQSNLTGSLADAMVDADIFVGVSVGNILTEAMVKSMANDAAVFAMANPIPEGDPEMMYPLVRVVGTGRSDFPNQINNVLAFPAIFRGAIDVQATRITNNMKLAASRAIANLISDEELGESYIMPGLFNRDLVKVVAKAVAEAAIADGVARKRR